MPHLIASQNCVYPQKIGLLSNSLSFLMIRMAMPHINVIRQKLCFFTTGYKEKPIFLVLFPKKGIKGKGRIPLVFIGHVQKSFVLGSLINKNGISLIVWYPIRGSKCHFQKAVFSAIREQRWYSLLRDDATAPAGTARSPVNEKVPTPFMQMSTRLISRRR